MIRVYISAPYSAAPEENTRAAMVMANALINIGFAPFNPHLSHYQNEIHFQEYDTWLELDMAWIDCCNFLLRMDGPSPGADREVSYANGRRVPVVRSVKELCTLAFCGYKVMVDSHGGKKILHLAPSLLISESVCLTPCVSCNISVRGWGEKLSEDLSYCRACVTGISMDQVKGRNGS